MFQSPLFLGDECDLFLTQSFSLSKVKGRPSKAHLEDVRYFPELHFRTHQPKNY